MACSLLSDEVMAVMTTVTVKVTVVAPPPCVINDDRPVEVEFGDVMTTRVDGSNYRRPVNYTLSCTSTSNAMKLQVKGNGAAFDVTVLQTNKAGLGIKLLQGDSKLAINSWLNFTYPNKPELWAVPVKQAGATLTGGEFSAGATMAVDYQ
ncbi:fimbrial protein [Pantoea ananatis]|uniref:fimbrial protein n=1 Tax=Pantoea ananas TaxID=553 RepID=UPI001B30FE86|nr:fimbrial protein [Pantoea ananatis]